MKRPEPDSPAARTRAAAAAEWLAKHDRGLTAAEQDAFLDWLAADPRHGEWLALHRRTTGDFAGLMQWRPEHSEEPNPDLLAPPRRPLRWLAPVALAAAAALAVSLTLWRPWANHDATPAVADYERRILEDGSTVELNRGAAITVAYAAGERRVALVRGEALFTVAKNPARPFIVRAGGVDVRAVGTAFNVRLSGPAVEVLVTEGRVAVDHGPASAPESASRSSPAEVRSPASELRVPISEISAGHRATIVPAVAAAPRIEPVTAAEIARALAWQPQLLDFSSVPLRLALAEFNRRNRVQFVLADPHLAELPIVASIRSNNIEGFARFLAETAGVRVERRSETEIVVRRR
jgi:transmembrane sensor